MSSLHPQCRELVRSFRAAKPPPTRGLTVDAMREFVASIWSGEDGPELPAGIERRSLTVPADQREIACQAFVPSDAERPPVVVHFHGGGWTHGNIESEALLCAQIADEARCAVLSVDYRLAPENPFPAALADGGAVIDYVAQGAAELSLDGARLGVLGGSVGANLAAAVALDAREAGPRIGCQVLLAPFLQHFSATPSRREFEAGYDFMPGWLDWFSSQYLKDNRDAADHALAAPLRAEGLRSLPPTFIGVAEYDPLRDEGTEYAERLRAEGVPVEFVLYEGMIHSFYVALGAVDRAREALGDVAGFLRWQLRGGTPVARAAWATPQGAVEGRG